MKLRVLFLLLLLAASLMLSCTFDPVESDAIAALGGEAPGVRRGPLHRPGQPCLLCHDGALGDPPEFTVAGTVFEDVTGQTGEGGAMVSITDSTGAIYASIVTNAAGNFYVTPAQWSPVFPLMSVTVDPIDGPTATMSSEIGRNGGCASCHVVPASASSPGAVYATTEEGLPP